MTWSTGAIVQNCSNGVISRLSASSAAAFSWIRVSLCVSFVRILRLAAHAHDDREWMLFRRKPVPTMLRIPCLRKCLRVIISFFTSCKRHDIIHAAPCDEKGAFSACPQLAVRGMRQADQE